MDTDALSRLPPKHDVILLEEVKDRLGENNK